MSDCRIPMPNYKAPTHSREQDELRIVIHFKDGSLPYPVVMNRLDREVECVTVDGVKFKRANECKIGFTTKEIQGVQCLGFKCSSCKGWQASPIPFGRGIADVCGTWKYCPLCGAKVAD